MVDLSRRALLGAPLMMAAAPTPAETVFDCQPHGTDQGQQGVARAQFPVDYAGEPLARIDAVAVAEDLLFAEMVTQRIPQATRVQPAVIPPIADEDAAHMACPNPPLRGFRLAAMICRISTYDHFAGGRTHE